MALTDLDLQLLILGGVAAILTIYWLVSWVRERNRPRAIDEEISDAHAEEERLRAKDPIAAARFNRELFQKVVDAMASLKQRAPHDVEAALEYARLTRDQIVGWHHKRKELLSERQSPKVAEALHDADVNLDYNRTNLLWVSQYLPAGHPWRTDVPESQS